MPHGYGFARLLRYGYAGTSGRWPSFSCFKCSRCSACSASVLYTQAMQVATRGRLQVVHDVSPVDTHWQVRKRRNCVKHVSRMSAGAKGRDYLILLQRSVVSGLNQLNKYCKYHR